MHLSGEKKRTDRKQKSGVFLERPIAVEKFKKTTKKQKCYCDMSQFKPTNYKNKIF